MKRLLLSLLLGLSLTTQISYAALTDQLTHYYSYNSGSTDSVGSNNGTDTNTPTYTPGKISNALTTVAASSQYTSFSQTSFLPWGTNAYTVNMWVKFASTGGNQALMMSTGGSAGASGVNMYLSGGSIQNDKPFLVGLGYTWSGADTNYHMWTFVSSSTGMATYLDGTRVSSNTNTSNIGNPGTTVPMGAYNSSGVIQAGWYFDGQMDEVGIWSRGLTPAEITQLYNGGAGLAYPFTPAATTPTTLGFFKFFKRF